MKQLAKISIIISMLFTFVVPISAEESTTLYVYTTDTSEFDEYAKESLAVHIYTYYGYLDNSLKLGKGMYVFGYDEIPQVVYPIWKDDKIVATYKIIYHDNVFSGTYSDGNVEQLNYAISVATKENPVKLFRYENQFYYSIGNTIYSASNGVGKIVRGIDFDENSFEKATSINVNNKIEYDQISTRTTTSKYLYWTAPEHNPSSTFYCYAYCLSPILRCLGYTAYTYNKISNDIREQEGIPMAAVEIPILREYLTNQGFLYSSSTGGSMGTSTVEIWVKNNNMYIMMGLTCLNENSTMKHFSVITGYSNVNGTYTYQVYDPQHNGTGGILTMSASTKEFTNSDGSKFKWDAGYFTHFRK